MILWCDTEDGQKKCSEHRDNQQRSQQLLDSASKQPTTVMSDETLQSNAAAAADAAADAAVDSDPTMGDTNAAALQEPGEHQEPVVGLLLAVCYYHGVDRAFSSTCDCFCLRGWLCGSVLWKENEYFDVIV